MRAIERLSERLLHVAEEIYLRAHGWKKMTETFGSRFINISWVSPSKYHWPKKANQPHSFGHAINSQKAASSAIRQDERLKKILSKKKDIDAD